MYHHIVDPDEQSGETVGDPVYNVAYPEFLDQLTYLHENSFHVMSLRQVEQHHSEGRKLPEKSVVLTFDDGYHSHFELALPALKRYHFSADFFLTVAHMGRRHYLTWEEAKQLCQSGMGIGSHGWHHTYLDDLEFRDAEMELQGSKDRLEQGLDTEISFLAPPGGRINPAVTRLARQAGYRGICTSRVGWNASVSDLFGLRRFPMKSSVTRDRFMAIVEQKPAIMWQYQAVAFLTGVAKKLLGNRRYDRVRNKLLAGRNAGH